MASGYRKNHNDKTRNLTHHTSLCGGWGYIFSWLNFSAYEVIAKNSVFRFACICLRPNNCRAYSDSCHSRLHGWWCSHSVSRRLPRGPLATRQARCNHYHYCFGGVHSFPMLTWDHGFRQWPTRPYHFHVFCFLERRFSCTPHYLQQKSTILSWYGKAFQITRPSWEKSTCHQCYWSPDIPSQMASNTELCYSPCWSEGVWFRSPCSSCDVNVVWLWPVMHKSIWFNLQAHCIKH